MSELHLNVSHEISENWTWTKLLSLRDAARTLKTCDESACLSEQLPREHDYVILEIWCNVEKYVRSKKRTLVHIKIHINHC